MDDGEIVAALAADDPGGVAAAYDRYAGPLYGYCRWMLRDHEQAASAQRETFATAARPASGLTDADQLRAFRRIALLQSVDVERPADRDTDLSGGALAARRLGIIRLAHRLEQAATLSDL